MEDQKETLKRRINYLLCSHNSRVMQLRQNLRGQGAPERRISMAEEAVSAHYEARLRELRDECAHDYTPWELVASPGVPWLCTTTAQRQCKVCLQWETQPGFIARAANEAH